MMRPPDMRAPTLPEVGAAGVSKGLETENYRNPTPIATTFAAAFIARRYRLSPPIAAVIVELSGIGDAA